MRYLRLVPILEDYRPPQSDYLHRNFNDKQLIILSFELNTLRLFHFVEVKSDNIVIEFGSVWSNELESNINLMFFVRKIPSKIYFFERTTREVLVLNPYLIGIVKSRLIHLEIHQFHIILYFDKGVLFLN